MYLKKVKIINWFKPETLIKSISLPDSDTVKEHFSTVFDTQDDDVFVKAVSMIEQTFKDRFDLSLQELFALPIR